MTGNDHNGTCSECPPRDAEACAGLYYRCCKNSPPASSDMRTSEETGRLPAADPCLRRALSVFRSVEDADHQVRLFPGWKKKFVATASLAAEHGRSMLTSGRQPTHTSWWPADGLDSVARAALFVVAREVPL